MDIGGYLSTSLIEWPGKIAAIIFVFGCNFRCPFCYNRDLVLPSKRLRGGKLKGDWSSSLKVEEEAIFADLKKRKKWVDGVVITGGEPTLQPDLAEFLKKIKDLGFLAMIETNGSQPEIMAQLLADQLLDYLAMDFKGPLDRYTQITKAPISNSKIKKAIRLIINSGIDFELRTTVVPGTHNQRTLIEMANQLASLAAGQPVKWLLQSFQPKTCLDPKFEKIKPYGKIKMEKFLKAVKRIIPGTEWR